VRWLNGRVTGNSTLTRIRGGWGLIFVAPATLLLLVFYILPIFYSLRMSFYDVGFIRDTWVGVENYRGLFQGTDFWGSVRVTAKFVIAYLFVALVLAYAIGLVLSRVSPRFCGAMLTLYHVPAIFTALATVTVWRWFYRFPEGGLNSILAVVGIGPVSWLGNPVTVTWAICFAMMGMLTGGQVLLYAAAIGQINEEILEAAQLDGSNWWQLVWYIITPLTHRVRLYLLLTAIVASLLIWEHPFFLTGGGPLGASRTVMLEIYHKGFIQGDMGTASAMTVLAIVFILGLAIVLVRRLREYLG